MELWRKSSWLRGFFSRAHSTAILVRFDAVLEINWALCSMQYFCAEKYRTISLFCFFLPSVNVSQTITNIQALFSLND